MWQRRRIHMPGVLRFRRLEVGFSLDRKYPTFALPGHCSSFSTRAPGFFVSGDLP
jgi:hypothetical protein